MSALRGILAALMTCVSLPCLSQIAPERTLDELKTETLARVERGAYPAAGLKLEDAREALATIHTLAPDDWARAWSAIGDRYRSRAAASQGDAARDFYYQAFLYYSLARFPTPNSAGKKVAYTQAIAAYLQSHASPNPGSRWYAYPSRARRSSATFDCPTPRDPPR